MGEMSLREQAIREYEDARRTPAVFHCDCVGFHCTHHDSDGRCRNKAPATLLCETCEKARRKE